MIDIKSWDAGWGMRTNPQTQHMKIPLSNGQYLERYSATDTRGYNTINFSLYENDGTFIRLFADTGRFPHKPQELKELLELQIK